MAAEFFGRWNEDALVKTRQLVARFNSRDELRDGFAAYCAANAPEAFVLYRELDFLRAASGARSHRGLRHLAMPRRLASQDIRGVDTRAPREALGLLKWHVRRARLDRVS